MTIGVVRQNRANVVILFILFFLSILILVLLLGRLKNNAEFNNNNAIAKKTVQHTLGSNTNSMFYGSNIDISQLLPTSPYYVKNAKGEDFIDISHRLGINMLRISSVLQAFPDQTPDVIYTKEQWDTVLNKMNSYGMKAVIIAETHSTNKNIYSDEISDDFLTQVKSYIVDSHVGSNSAVYAIDLKNEPTLDAHNLSMIQQERDIIKQTYPTMLVTVGGWKVPTGTDKQGKLVYRWNQPQDAQLLNTIVDFYSPHIYGFDQSEHHAFNNLVGMVKGYVNAMELIANNKSILFSEFGSANGDSVSDQQTVGSKELQANTYYAMYQTLNTYGQANVIGAIGYVLYSRNQYPDSWAILKDKGDYVYPAAYVVQKLSTGNAEKIIPMPYADKDVPDNIVLSDKDNLATKSAHVNDIVLLGISGAKTNQYKMTIIPQDAADIIQNLQYNSQYSKFFAILKVKKSGSIPVSVVQTSPITLPPFIYTTTLIVP
ncbi:MAG TPA: hypothetical protein VLF89_01670 [Candidatus Saccharimonadales bacterium]|nr:hypothetical protein [Candidatus Saccharimonadales bacterium]